MDQSAEMPAQPGFATGARQDDAWRTLLPTDVQEAVSSALRDAAHSLVIPSFRSSRPAELSRKASGTLVTQIDRDVESRLAAVVTMLLPNSRVIGEEAVAADPKLLMHLGDEWVWVIDPLDGTANFVEGQAPIAMMVSLLNRGTPILAWILDPLEDILLTRGRGEGLTTGQAAAAAPSLRDLRGAAWIRYFDDELRKATEGRFSAVGQVTPGCKCTGAEYLSLLQGQQDFVLFWRSMPWDHTAGILLLQESGGHAAYLNRDPFRPGAKRYGLLAARSRQIWDQVWTALIEGVPDPEGLLSREVKVY
ncbi:inositol monophosphatase family protein [Methylobacterium oxalidis]|uniref:Inositol monophosphatase n=1 Tax=Methylobacterium oxalidis TaxID=944322 RepID=A0A512JDT3_9HYPH|nr:inositol monophosphatase family protein [Methylobacterium oxalidis]GEP08114.1 inositol monophosphatase [Methylobacterium oxalidis]GJE35950.1 3'(2'),5'-bisphosphate nucleotidase CysQ [Methylobacterium oxalidis]GLS65195.1 inositol monophosphatase [Methylobacterium oxalidis]